MGREDYIAVAADDWYQRRRQDAEGRFFVGVANQGPRQGEGGSTRQGIYALTAGGKLLAYKNAGQNPQAMRDLLRQGLAAWRKLPPSERAPGAVNVPDHGPFDRAYHREPPAGGLILKAFTRCLDRAANDASAGFTDAECRIGGGDEAGRDHLWLTEAESKSFLPANAKVGDTFPLPPRISERLLRFHLVDNTRGEPPFWRRGEIRRSDLNLTVEARNASGTRLRLEGAALLATDADAAAASRGFDVRLLGFLDYDARKQAWRRFDLVAIGEHWGDGPYTKGSRPGRAPLGVAVSLARGNSPADRIAPQGAREWGDYFGTAR
jgi:hypothetical protein